MADPRPAEPRGEFATLIGAWHRLVASTAARRGLHLVLLAVAVWYAAAITADGSLQDFDAYYRGGWGLLHGGDPYDPGNPGSILPFVYPPFAALVVAPLVILGRRWGAFVLTVTSLALAFWTVRLVIVELTSRLRPTDSDTRDRPEVPWLTALAVVVAMGSEPFWATVGLGQINLVLMALVVTDLLRLRSTRWAGVLIGVAVGIKLTPAIFVLHLLTTRRFRAAATAITSAAATVAVGAALMARPSWDYFVERSVVGEWWDTVLIVGKPGNQSVDGSLTRWTGSEALARTPWFAVATVIAVAGLWAASEVFRRVGEVEAMTLVAMTGLLVAPTSWTHYWIWWIVGACALVALAAREEGRQRLSAGAALVVWSVPFLIGRRWFPPYPEDIPTDQSVPMVLLDNMYVLVGTAAVVVGTTAALRWRIGGGSVQ